MDQIDVDTRWSPDSEFDREVERTRSYAHAVAEVARELESSIHSGKGKVRLLELHDSMEAKAIEIGDGDREKGLSTFLSDGLHLTGDGYRFLTHRLLSTIQTHFPELDPEKMPMFLPGWEAVDQKNPTNSFPEGPLTPN